MPDNAGVHAYLFLRSCLSFLPFMPMIDFVYAYKKMYRPGLPIHFLFQSNLFVRSSLLFIQFLFLLFRRSRLDKECT